MDFIKDLIESRMTKDDTNTKKLTYTDCCERVYLILLTFEAMRKYPPYKKVIQQYCINTVGFEKYKFYRIMGTDLYNFLYFLVGDDAAQNKLKDPETAIMLKNKSRIPIAMINMYLKQIATGKNPDLKTKFFLDIEASLNITNPDYRFVRREINDWSKLNLKARKRLVTRLIYAFRAKLRSSDLIDTFEKFANDKGLESSDLVDNEPVISTPDIRTTQGEIALYRYLVGANNIAQTKRFLDQAKNGKAVSAEMLQGYLPIIELIDDIVKGGPSHIQNLKALHQRTKKRK